MKKAGEGKIVTRLKGGDPCIFGRGGRRSARPCRTRYTFEFVSGVSSAHAVPAYAGIPVTKARSHIDGHLRYRHEDPEKDGRYRLAALAKVGGTLVFLMSFRNLE